MRERDKRFFIKAGVGLLIVGVIGLSVTLLKDAPVFLNLLLNGKATEATVVSCEQKETGNDRKGYILRLSYDGREGRFLIARALSEQTRTRPVIYLTDKPDTAIIGHKKDIFTAFWRKSADNLVFLGFCALIGAVLLVIGLRMRPVEGGAWRNFTPLECLMKAVEQDRIPPVQILLQHGVSLSDTDEKGFTPLHLAQSVKMAEFLISNGADVHAENNLGDTPLHCAAATDNAELVQFLLQSGAPLDAKNGNGETALFYVDSLAVAETLVASGLSATERADDGTTPLHTVSDPKVVTFLLDNGADPNAEDNEGNTPLHSQCESGMDDIDSIKILLARGANLYACNKEGRTPRMVAEEEGAQELVEFFRTVE